MTRFLSPEWVAALDAATSNSSTLAEAVSGVTLCVQQTVTDGPDGDRSWHVEIGGGSVHVLDGPAERPDVTFTQDHDTAVAVGTGELSAQAAFMLGRLRVGGEVSRLVEQRGLFEGLDDVFAEVRATTTY